MLGSLTAEWQIPEEIRLVDNKTNKEGVSCLVKGRNWNFGDDHNIMYIHIYLLVIVIYTMYSIIFLKIWWGSIPGDGEGLFLALHSRIRPGSAKGTIWVAGDRTQV